MHYTIVIPLLHILPLYHYHEEPPQIVSSSPAVVEVTDGMPDPVELVCIAQGRPLPTITWLREAEEVRTEGLVSVRSDVIGDTVNSTLRIERVTFDDRGTHFCEATNPEGQISVRIELVVRCEWTECHNYITICHSQSTPIYVRFLFCI